MDKSKQRDYKVGDRVAKDVKKDRGGPAFTALGTIAYVKTDRVGVKWDLRRVVFPAQRAEIRYTRGDEA